MDTISVAHVGSNVNYVPITDSEGRTILVAEGALAVWRAQGRDSIDLHIALSPAGERRWLTTTEAAALHVHECGELGDDTALHASSLKTASMRILRACRAGVIRSRGDGRDRRIDPDSLATWRLDERDALLSADERY